LPSLQLEQDGGSRRLLRNSIFSASSWTVQIAVSFLFVPFYVRYMGYEGFGIYALLTGISGYLGILDLGFGAGLIKFVSQYHASGDRESLADMINAALTLQIAAALATTAVLLALNNKLVLVLHVSPGFQNTTSMCLYIVSLALTVNIINSLLSSVLMGLQRYALVGKVDIFAAVISNVLTLVLLMKGGGIVSAVLASALSSIPVCVCYLWLVFNKIEGYRPKLAWDLPKLRTLFAFTSHVFLFKFCVSANTYLVRLIIAVVAGPVALTVFLLPMRITVAVASACERTVAVLFPHVSSLLARDETLKVRESYTRFSRYLVAGSTPLFLVVILFARPLLALWIDPLFANSAWQVLTLLAIAQTLNAWTTVAAYFSMGLGYSNVAAKFSLASLGVTVCCVGVLAGYFSSIGAAAGILLASLISPFFAWYCTRFLIGIDWKKYIGDIFAGHLIPAALFGLLSIGISFHWREHPLTAVILGSVLMFLYYGRLVWLKIIDLSDLRTGTTELAAE
jgi:O-antigen/teichoic acid export membrane protein